MRTSSGLDSLVLPGWGRRFKTFPENTLSIVTIFLKEGSVKNVAEFHG